MRTELLKKSRRSHLAINSWLNKLGEDTMSTMLWHNERKLVKSFHLATIHGILAFPGTYPVGCCMPDAYLHDHTQLAYELFNLLIFRTGRPFDDKNTAATKNDWTQVVWDILETGVKKAFNRKNSGMRDTPRGIGETIGMLDGTSFAKTSSKLPCSTVADIIGHDNVHTLYAQDNDDPPGYRDRPNNTDEPEGGVSVVLIETYERESER